jgi:hypothetical protein
MDGRSEMEDVASTLEYAATITNAKYSTGLEEFIFADSANVPILRSLFADLRLKIESAAHAASVVFTLGKMDADEGRGASYRGIKR